MARSHEIRDWIHVRKPSVDFGGLTGWPKGYREQMDFQEEKYIDGNVTVYKSRLVTKGFRQIQRVDYDETFSPVAKLKSVRILLVIAAYYDYEIWQMDVKTSFLNGDIDEELYMVQPKGFVDPKDANKV